MYLTVYKLSINYVKFNAFPEIVRFGEENNEDSPLLHRRAIGGWLRETCDIKSLPRNRIVWEECTTANEWQNIDITSRNAILANDGKHYISLLHL